jgi:hypothetical protein
MAWEAPIELKATPTDVADSTATTPAEPTASPRVRASSRGTPATTTGRRTVGATSSAAARPLAEVNRREGSLTMLRPMASTRAGLAS